MRSGEGVRLSLLTRCRDSDPTDEELQRPQPEIPDVYVSMIERGRYADRFRRQSMFVLSGSERSFCCGFNGESADEAIADGRADAIAFDVRLQT